MRDTFRNLVFNFLKRMPDPFGRLPEEWRRVRLRQEINQRIREADSDWKPGPKVFGIGLSKTGTGSLSLALEQLGYTSLHWKKGGKIIGWPEFFWADAATDTPCSAQFEALYHTFEESKFIYTVRDVESWKQSIINHYGGVERPRELRRRAKRKEYGDQWEVYNLIRKVQLRECLYAQHDSWEEAYHAFDNRVRRFFEDKPDDRFLEMSITGSDGWESLCSFLGHEVPDCSFPHVNRSEYK